MVEGAYPQRRKKVRGLCSVASLVLKKIIICWADRRLLGLGVDVNEPLVSAAEPLHHLDSDANGIAKVRFSASWSSFGSCLFDSRKAFWAR